MGQSWWHRWQERLMGARAGVAEWAPQPYMLEGELTLSDLLAFRAWAEVLAEPYTPEASAVQQITAHRAGAELWVFLATWCGDCKRELPRLLQILAITTWPEEHLHLVGVDWDKRDPAGLVDVWRVERVPTLVVVRQGREMGRIIERPRLRLEQELAALLGA